MEAPGDVNRVLCTLILEYGSGEEASKIHRSVELDNQGYLRTEVRDNRIVAEIGASSLNSLLHTLDDFLACASVAEKIVAGEGHSE
ncbi:MAG TPA: KEOPS complex subunit Pcc1 [Thermoplasmata archaeon]